MNKNNFDDIQFLTIKEASLISRISISQLYELMNQGKFPSAKIGRSRRIPKREFLGYLESTIAR